MQEEGWNVASGKRTPKNTVAKQPHVVAKSTSRNRFEALQNEEKDTDPPEENVEEDPSPEQEASVEDITQWKTREPEEVAKTDTMKATAIISKGSVT